MAGIDYERYRLQQVMQGVKPMAKSTWYDHQSTVYNSIIQIAESKEVEYLQMLRATGQRLVSCADAAWSQHPAAAAFLHGPQHLNCTEYDVWTHSEYGTNLSLVAGQQNTYTALHVDGGSDSVWHLLVEGQKLWILARPESSAKAYASLPSNRTVEWKRITDGVEGWMVDERVMLVVQNAGDLIYIPRDWPHIVKHYTDTLAVSSNVLHAWDLPRALRGVDFTAMSDCDYAMYEQGMDAVRGNERLQLVLRMRMQQLEQLWQQKGREREEAKRRRREEAEAGERETGEGSEEAEGGGREGRRGRRGELREEHVEWVGEEERT